MLDYYGQMTVFGAGAAVGAAEITLLMIFLQQRQYMRLAVAMVAGMIIVRIMQGVVLGFSPRLQDIAAVKSSGVPARPGLLFLVGVILLISAVMQLRKKKGEGDESGGRIGRILERVGPVTAAALGMVVVLVNIKAWGLTLAAVEATRDYSRSTAAAVLNFMLYVVLASALLLIPLVMQAVMPERSDRVLQRVSEWLKKNGNIVVAVVTGIIGLYLAVRGGYYIINR